MRRRGERIDWQGDYRAGGGKIPRKKVEGGQAGCERKAEKRPGGQPFIRTISLFIMALHCSTIDILDIMDSSTRSCYGDL